MAHLEGEVLINRPVDVVFDFVADARNEPRYNRNAVRAEKVSMGAVQRGTRFHTETRGMGRRSDWIIERTEYERPRKLSSSVHTTAVDITGCHTFEGVDGRTRMRWSWDVKPRGVFRLLGPLIGRMGQRMEERNGEKLKNFLERQEAQSG